MKKLVLLILMSIMLFASNGFAATVTLTPVERPVVDGSGVVKELTYTSTTSVTTGTDLFVKLKVPYSFGYIKKTSVTFSSSSPNCDIMLSTTDGETAHTINTIFSITDYNLAESEALPCNIFYNTGGNYWLFLRVSNQSATPTGNWSLKLVTDNRR